MYIQKYSQTWFICLPIRYCCTVGDFGTLRFIGQIWSLKAENSCIKRHKHTLWNRRRIRVTTADWHNTVGIPPSWQLLYFDTPVNSKFDKNHHTWKTKKEEPDQFVKIFLEAISSKWAQQVKSGFGWLLDFFGEWIWTNIWIANCHFKILKI